MERQTRKDMSLVKYACPVMVVTPEGHHTHISIPGEVRSKIFQRKKEEKDCLEMQNLLNDMFPPRQWTEEGAVWRQQVSAEPISRLDVLKLREKLDLLLKQRQARKGGICPVRRDIYVQLFDEMIRQETVVCPERGTLLMRIRDEFKMSLTTLSALFESSIVYAIQKSVEAEDSMINIEAEANLARRQHKDVLNEVQALQKALDQSAKRAKEFMIMSQKRFDEEIEFLTLTNTQLKGQLDSVYMGKK